LEDPKEDDPDQGCHEHVAEEVENVELARVACGGKMKKKSRLPEWLQTRDHVAEEVQHVEFTGNACIKLKKIK
jgi:hypothetical protein